MIKPPLFVEFVGLPGSGKSTVTQKVVAELQALGYPVPTQEELRLARAWGGSVVRKAPLYLAFLWFAIRRPTLLGAVAGFVLRTRPFNRASVWRGVVLLRRVKLVNDYVCESYKVVILEEGLLQTLWSVGLTAETPKFGGLLDTILDHYVEAPYTFVYLRVDAETACQRIRGRDGDPAHRIDGMSQASLRRLLDKHARRLQHLALHEVEALHLDGTAAVVTNASEVVRWLEGRLRASI